MRPHILRASRAQLLQVRGIGDETAAAIADWEKTIDLSGELKRIATIRLPHRHPSRTQNYPELLQQIYDPPIVLYVKGELSAKDKNAVAMVGSRMTTHYGIEAARKLAYQLAYLGVTVVSGGARGIDTAAHQGAFSGKGRTIAVLGTGINLVSPPENAELFEHIAAQGAVITQFPFNRQADKQIFPHPQPHRRGHDAGHGGGRGQPDQRRAHHRQLGHRHMAARSSRCPAALTPRAAKAATT